MREAIDAGLVPIGKRFFNQDITSIMEAPDLTPGRSWTAKVLGFVPGLFDEGAGEFRSSARSIRRATSGTTRCCGTASPTCRWASTSTSATTCWRRASTGRPPRACRALRQPLRRRAAEEAMSTRAQDREHALFSRSFTLGNLGVMKDMLTGLPKDVLAQIERDAGFRQGIHRQRPLMPKRRRAEPVKYAKTMAAARPWRSSRSTSA
jgi:hypothetical protein